MEDNFYFSDEQTKAELKISQEDLTIIKAVMKIQGNIPEVVIKRFLKPTIEKYYSKKQLVSFAEFIYFENMKRQKEAEEIYNAVNKELDSPIKDEDLLELHDFFEFLMEFAEKYDSNICRNIVCYAYDMIINEINAKRKKDN